MAKANPIFVALDLDNLSSAISVAEKVCPYVGGFKIGPRLSLRYGAEIVRQLVPLGPVFVDNKYFDIPNTMESAVEAAFETGATYVTIHAQSGRDAMLRLSSLEKQCRAQRPFHILAVTILTSFEQGSLPEVSRNMPISQQVLSLARLTQDSGISGLVCSAEELSVIRPQFPQFKLVVPGIRWSDESAHDQKRVADPQSALKMGASHLVVGRPIVDAKDPVAAAKRFFEATESFHV